MRADSEYPLFPGCVIAASEDRTYILQKPTGEVTAELALRYTLQAHLLGSELGIACHLVDVTEARNVDSILHNRNFAYEDMKAAEFNPRARVALLVSPDDHSHDFVATVARNAGLDVTLFRDRAAALRHLQGGAGNDPRKNETG